MTAEVIVMNKWAVALAADSSVTITKPIGQKSYNMANKVFSLSEEHSIGFMLFGNPEFMGIPWEVVIKLFKDDIMKRKSEDFSSSVKALTEQFLSFIKNLENKLSATVLSEYFETNLQEYHQNLKTMLEKRADNGLYNNTQLNTEFSSGIVIVGYGAEEIFPSFKSYIIESSLIKKCKIKEYKSVQISLANEIAIEPFAQEELVKMFLYGISSDHKKVFKVFINWMLDSYTEKIKELFSVNDAQMRDIEALGRSFVEEIEKDMPRYSRLKYHNPIREAVSVLPRMELALFAESLVTLTSLRLRYSNEPETVGGIVDVAVITKLDGFKWVKGKHVQ